MADLVDLLPYACRATPQELANALDASEHRRYLYLGWGRFSILIGYRDA